MTGSRELTTATFAALALARLSALALMIRLAGQDRSSQVRQRGPQPHLASRCEPIFLVRTAGNDLQCIIR